MNLIYNTNRVIPSQKCENKLTSKIKQKCQEQSDGCVAQV